MLVEKQKQTIYKTITFRLEEELIKDFRTLCKKYNYKQVSIIENAMKKAILEINEMEKDNEHNE